MIRTPNDSKFGSMAYVNGTSGTVQEFCTDGECTESARECENDEWAEMLTHFFVEV